MKKIILSAFISVFFAASLAAGGAQNIQNEYWSWDNGNPGALVFENYFFSDDGTFRFSWGYSGGSYFGGWYGGTYYYDSAKQKIVFNSTDKGTMGGSEKMGRPAPKEVKIIEFMDSGMLRVDINAAHEKNTHHMFDGVMQRHQGRIKEQTWTFMQYSTVYEFYFDPQGNCFYREGKQSGDLDAQYECEYNIIDDTLFLNVKSARVMKFNIAKNDNVKYDPPVKTYIRLGNALGGEIQVEKVNFASILGGSRKWDYKDGKCVAANKLPAVKQKDFYSYKIEKANAGEVLVEEGAAVTGS